MRIFLVLKASYGTSSIVNHDAESPIGLSLMTAEIDKAQTETGNCEHGDPRDTDDVSNYVPGVNNYISPSATPTGLALY